MEKLLYFWLQPKEINQSWQLAAVLSKILYFISSCHGDMVIPNSGKGEWEWNVLSADEMGLGSVQRSMTWPYILFLSSVPLSCHHHLWLLCGCLVLSSTPLTLSVLTVGLSLSHSQGDQVWREFNSVYLSVLQFFPLSLCIFLFWTNNFDKNYSPGAGKIAWR